MISEAIPLSIRRGVRGEALKPNQSVLIAGAIMHFYYWLGDIPVFTYTAEGFQINYIDHAFNRDTFFQLQ